MKNKEKKLKRAAKEKLNKNNKAIGKQVKQKSAKVSELKHRIKMLEALVEKRERTIAKLKTKLDESESHQVKKQGKQKSPGGATKLLRSQRSSRVGLNQRDAWRRHGYLRSRYEHYLEQNEEKTTARELAGQDLVEKFGEEAGYTESQLEHILS
jgi:predicted RNase H-like nuclease (RuvC/YqgF family)